MVFLTRLFKWPMFVLRRENERLVLIITLIHVNLIIPSPSLLLPSLTVALVGTLRLLGSRLSALTVVAVVGLNHGSTLAEDRVQRCRGQNKLFAVAFLLTQWRRSSGNFGLILEGGFLPPI